MVHAYLQANLYSLSILDKYFLFKICVGNESGVRFFYKMSGEAYISIVPFFPEKNLNQVTSKTFCRNLNHQFEIRIYTQYIRTHCGRMRNCY